MATRLPLTIWNGSTRLAFTPAQELFHSHAPHRLRHAHGDATAPHDPEWFHAPSLQLRSCSTATPLTACALLDCLYFISRDPKIPGFELFHETVPHFQSSIANSGAKNTMVIVEFSSSKFYW